MSRSGHRLAIIVQARMGSTRLPGKVLRPVLGEPLLAHQLRRLQQTAVPHDLLVATSTNPADDPIADFCSAFGASAYRGSEMDVLARFSEAASAVNADDVVRVTADCPLIDPDVVAMVIERYRAEGCDYASNTLERTFPRGLDVEIFSRATLIEAEAEATAEAEREHVTPFIYRRPRRYRLSNVRNDRDEGDERWTVDTSEDFELIRRILESFLPEHPAFRLADVRALLAEHPDWRLLNRMVQQKDLEL